LNLIEIIKKYKSLIGVERPLIDPVIDRVFKFVNSLRVVKSKTALKFSSSM